MEILRGTHITCNCIPQTIIPETTETMWCCSRRSTYVIQVVVVPITDYVCPCLTNHDIGTCENIQKRATFVIFPGWNYHDALETSKLATLSTRKDLLYKTLFMQIS